MLPKKLLRQLVRSSNIRTPSFVSNNNIVRYFSIWNAVPLGPKDPILGVTEAFNADKHPDKLNLGVGAYRDDNNKPVILKSVQEASKRIYDSMMHNEYAPIAGQPDFIKPALKLAYGQDSPVIKNNQLAGIQALSGTGALRIAGEFFNRFGSSAGLGSTVYLPNQTWGNHFPIFNDAGLQTTTYRYYKASTRGLDIEGLLEDIEKAPKKSIFLFHACAHNPTGVDPSQEQWKQISDAVIRNEHFVIIDSAYQAFASGDPTRDAFAIRHFVSQGVKIALAQSFSKNFGLYGQRTGTLSIVVEDAEEVKKVESQLKILARAMYSNPPVHGSRIVTSILTDPVLLQQWHVDVKEMADRIITMRTMLYDQLQHLGSSHNWNHIKEQVGMFCYSGLTPEQVDQLTNEYHIYLTRNGRISMAGLTTKNVNYLANAIHKVTS